MFTLSFTDIAAGQFKALEEAKHLQKRFKSVRKALGYLETNPRHPGLQTHKYETLSEAGREVFEAYAENNAPGAYRIFWHYGHHTKEITIIAITPHP